MPNTPTSPRLPIVVTIHTRTNKMIDSIIDGNFPIQIYINPRVNRIFSVTIGSDAVPSTVSIINGRTNRVLSELNPGQGSIAGVVNVRRNKLYIVNQISNDVAVIAPRIVRK